VDSIQFPKLDGFQGAQLSTVMMHGSSNLNLLDWRVRFRCANNHAYECAVTRSSRCCRVEANGWWTVMAAGLAYTARTVRANAVRETHIR